MTCPDILTDEISLHQTDEVLKRVGAEPGEKSLLCKFLALCNPAQSLHGLAEALQTYPEMKTSMHTPQVYLRWLMDCGAIRTLGQESTLQYETTPAGTNALNKMRSGNCISELCAEDPQCRSGFLLVMHACQNGKARSELETILAEEPAVQAGTVYASYFIERLENIGAVEWVGSWRTTKLGKIFLENEQSVAK